MVFVATVPADELLARRLGQQVTPRALLRGIRGVNLDDLHAAQSGLVSNVLQKLVEGPLRPLRVGTDFGTLRPHFAQVFDSNGATMCSGVVYDHFGHDVIFVLGTSGLLALDAAQAAGIFLVAASSSGARARQLSCVRD